MSAKSTVGSMSARSTVGNGTLILGESSRQLAQTGIFLCLQRINYDSVIVVFNALDSEDCNL